MTIYLCERCGSRFNSARFAHIELCPRCLLRDDAASHLVFVPGGTARKPSESPPESPDKTAPTPPADPDAASAELG
jgi:hypothetical protein